MRFPILKQNSFSKSTINDLSGGLNLRDNQSDVKDNQLTDSLNMWHYNGMLTSRPAMRTGDDLVVDSPEEPVDNNVTAVPATYEIIINIAGNPYRLVSNTLKFKTPNDRFLKKVLQFYGVRQRNMINYSDPIELAESESFFVFQKKNYLYVVTSEGRILTSYGAHWYPVADDEIYSPLIMVNGLTDGAGGLESGDLIEGYNLIGNRYRMVYSTVNRNIITSDNITTHTMVYKLLKSVVGEEFNSKTLTATIISDSGNKITHTVILNGTSESREETVNTDGLRLVAHAEYISFEDGEGMPAKVRWNNYIQNNLTITAPYLPTIYEKNKVFQMRRVKWFGGASDGINGGTRLFLCANTNEPNLMIWSGLNNPLYFSENAYAYVGEDSDSSPITNFAQAEDCLYIFKPNKVYATKYKQGNLPTAQQIINQDVIDMATSYVYFPLWTVNDKIGCDCPDTIQLCRNRLVWCHSNGNVYTLVNNSQYNERTIYTVGEMIKRELTRKKEDGTNKLDLKHCSSVDYNGHYFIVSPNADETFVMDYNTSGFQYPYSFNKDEDANASTIWWHWQNNIADPKYVYLTAVESNNEMMIFGYHDSESTANRKSVAYRLDYSQTIDSDILDAPQLAFRDRPFTSMLQTKLYDFGAPERRKTVPRVNIEIGKDGNEPIKVEWLCESGTDESEFTMYDESQKPYDISYTDNVALFPTLCNTLRLGVKMSSQGRLSLNNMVIKFRFTGGAR